LLINVSNCARSLSLKLVDCTAVVTAAGSFWAQEVTTELMNGIRVPGLAMVLAQANAAGKLLFPSAVMS